MANKPTVALIVGTLEINHDEASRMRGLAQVMIAGQTLRIRVKSRVLQYLRDDSRYLIGYVSDGYADTITVLVERPTMMQLFRMQERQKDGSLPTREVWKKKKYWKPSDA